MPLTSPNSTGPFLCRRASAPLQGRDTECAHLFADKKAAEDGLKDDAKAINILQDKLCERRRALPWCCRHDTSGKDGTVRGVFDRCGPPANVTAFGKPRGGACPRLSLARVWPRPSAHDRGVQPFAL